MPKLIASIIINMGILGGLQLLSEGSLKWWRIGMYFSIVLVGTMTSTTSVYQISRDSLGKRIVSFAQKEHLRSEKIIILIYIATFMSLIAFISLDLFRCYLMGNLGFLLSTLSIALFVAGWWAFTLAHKLLTGI